MLNHWRVTLFFLLITSAAAPCSATVSNVPFWQAVSDAQNAAKNGDCKTALELVAVALTQPAELTDDMQSVAYETGADCAVGLDEMDLAYSYALAGTRLAEASDWLWQSRLEVELYANHPEAALTTVEAMANGRNAALNGAPVRLLFDLDKKLRKAKAETLRRRLLQILVSPAYRPNEVVPNIDFFLRAYADLLVAGGDRTAAASVVARIDDPSILMQLSLDQRLRDMLPSTFDARLSIEHWLERMRKIAILHPDSLEVIVEIAARQRQLGDASGALAILQNARPIGKHATRYSDFDTQVNWWWDGLGRTQKALGHYPEAVLAYRAGTSVQERGNLNVSQWINLAEAQIRMGHASDALATLAIFKALGAPMSPYGDMEMRFAHSCASSMIGKVEDTQADIDFLTAHDGDSSQALPDAFLCSGNLDGAARAFAARLNDPSRRSAALRELSDYATLDARLPVDPVYGHLQALKARADVQATIAKAGGIGHFNVLRDEF